MMSRSGFAPPGSGQGGASYDKPPPSSASRPRLLSTRLLNVPATGSQSQSMPSRNVIPGLGFAAPPCETLLTTFASHPSLKIAPASMQHIFKEPPKPAVGGQTDGQGSEEGEISEGEVEDIYEPPSSRHQAKATESRQSGASATGSNFQFLKAGNNIAHGARREADQNSRWPAAPADLVTPVRQRSGSYSPPMNPPGTGSLLSILAPGFESAINRTDFASQGSQKPSSGATNFSKQSEGHDARHAGHSGTNLPSAGKSVAATKQQARQAILQLLPYNVHYQHYLDQGVDRAILDDLFQDLGLQIPQGTKPPNAPKPPSKPAAGAVRVEPKVPQNTGGPSQPPPPPQPATAQPPAMQPAKSLNSSEERKDRIARLLAAKGSKSAAPASATTSPKAATPASTSKTNKSKLLQEKMEALRRSRALLRQKRQSASPAAQVMPAMTANAPAAQLLPAVTPNASVDQLMPAITPNASGAQLMPAITPNASVAQLMPSSTANASTIQDDNSNKPSPVPASAPEQTSPIPGLFLSPPQPLPPTVSMKQTTKAPLAKPPLRPFDQNIGSRPFLIHVSDDEDAGEMDIDRPCDSHSPINTVTPPQKTVAIRGLPNVSLSRNASATTSRSTPPNGAGGAEDLAVMNKRIEDMKRKIAEAEARKKAKIWHQPSPAASPLPQERETTNDNAANGVAASESASKADEDKASVSSPAASIEQPPASPEKDLVESVAQSPSGTRDSGSRAASERIPLIEARRKAQIMKLQILQTQIAEIEREIQDGMQEEATLKQHLEESGSKDQGQVQGAVLDAPDINMDESMQVDQNPTQSDSVDTADASRPSTSKSDGNSDKSHSNNDIDMVSPADAPTDQDMSPASMPTQSEHIESDAGSVIGAKQSEGAASSVQHHEAVSDLAHEQHDVDVVMKDVGEAPPGNSEGESDDYEPPDASPSAVQAQAQRQAESEAKKHQSLLAGAMFSQKSASISAPNVPQSSSGQAEHLSEPGRNKMEVLTGQRSEQSGSRTNLQQPQEQAAGKSQSTFTPYETPLQYFHAYRFHPNFKQSVAGGLRSLTYSNKIDVQKQWCPDELEGQTCPRGSQCEYQHFEHVKAPDDQILLQLGAADNYRDEQKADYIAGLRQLLTDFRNRKVKDFNTISQGIIDYRARFHGDKSKILPLGSVSI